MTLGKGSKINIKFSLTWDLAQTFHQSTYKILRRLLLLLLLLRCYDKSFYINWDLCPMIQGYSDKKKNEALRALCPLRPPRPVLFLLSEKWQSLCSTLQGHCVVSQIPIVVALLELCRT